LHCFNVISHLNLKGFREVDYDGVFLINSHIFWDSGLGCEELFVFVVSERVKHFLVTLQTLVQHHFVNCKQYTRSCGVLNYLSSTPLTLNLLVQLLRLRVEPFNFNLFLLFLIFEFLDFVCQDVQVPRSSCLFVRVATENQGLV